VKPVNLNKVRKAKKKAAAKVEADANAIRFGRSKADKAQDEAQKRQDAARLDRHLRDRT